MPWVLWMVAVVAWLSAWIAFMARQTSALEDDARVERLGVLLPPFAILSCLGFFFIAPGHDLVTHTIVMLVHHAAIAVLFVFLVGAEFIQVEALLKIRKSAATPSIALTYRRLWAFTKIAPGAAAPVILLTGLYLIWESPQTNAPSHAWLFTIIVVFCLFFVDGLIGYTPMVGDWHREWDAAAKGGTTVRRRVAFDSVQLLVHCLSWPFLFVAGLTRFDAPNPLSESVQVLQNLLSFLPSGWPGVAVALVLLLLSAIVVITVRTLPRCFGR